MPRILTSIIPIGLGFLGFTLAGCEGPQTPGSGPAASPTSTTTEVATHYVANRRASECPVSHAPIGSQQSARRFAGKEILFRSESEAASFDELPGELKRIVAGRQYLGRLGVANESCMITARPLPIDAHVVRIDAVHLGFTNEEHWVRFNELAEADRMELLAPYLVRASGIENTHCPQTGEALRPGGPTIGIEDVVIGFRDEAAREAFESETSNHRSETLAAFVLPSRGVVNTTCPISSKPLRLDSPVFEVNGTLIGVRNISAARTFKRMTATEQAQLLPKAPPTAPTPIDDWRNAS